jgi:hypothetical protein
VENKDGGGIGGRMRGTGGGEGVEGKKGAKKKTRN